MKIRHVDPTILHELFVYTDGVLLWGIARGNKSALSPAGCTVEGYINIRIGEFHYKAHNLIWIMFKGEIPENFVVDHKDGNNENNHIDNLRLATFSQNVNNSKKRKNVSSKYKGVSFNKDSQKWRAYIMINNKSKYIGQFSNEEDAHAAWCKVAENVHGEFFRAA